MTNKTMRVAMYYHNDDVRVEAQPIPTIGPGELLVRTEVCGLCGGETMEWYLAERAPKVLGHEPTGTVVALGEGVTKFKEGDRVFVHHHVACMSANTSAKRRSNQVVSLSIYASQPKMLNWIPCSYRMKSVLRLAPSSSRWPAV